MRILSLLLVASFVSLTQAQDYFPPTGSFAQPAAFPPTGQFAPKSKEEDLSPSPQPAEDTGCKDCKKPALPDVTKPKYIDQLLSPRKSGPKYVGYTPYYVNGHSTPDSHLTDVHHVDPSLLVGLTQAEKDRLHGKMHTTSQQRLVFSSNSGCPGGVCPLPSRRFRR